MATPIQINQPSRKLLWELYYTNPGASYNAVKNQTARNLQSATPEDKVYNRQYDAYMMIPVDYGRVVDVVNDYAWTMSPKEARSGAPYIYMKELAPKRGADLQRAVYSMHAFFDGLKQGGKFVGLSGDVEKKIDNFRNTAVNKVSNLFADGADFANKTYPWVGKLVGNVGKVLSSAIKAIADGNLKDIDHLKPYDMLYDCDETGWEYKFPLFGDDIAKSPPNVYSDESNSGMKYVTDNMNNITNMIGGFFTTLNSANNNIVRNTEIPKIYSFNASTPTFTIKFPLINTIDDETARRNYDLIQLLKYQSRPYRADKNTILPTYIYEIIIPGFKYLPYAFIQNIDIQLQGVRRLIPTSFRFIDKNKTTIVENVEIICPEAYEITITLQSLTNDTQNFMVEYMKNDRKLLKED